MFLVKPTSFNRLQDLFIFKKGSHDSLAFHPMRAANLTGVISFCILLSASPQLMFAQDTVAASPSKKNGLLKAVVAPAALVSAGALSFPLKYDVRDWRNREHPNFHTNADNYLQFAPAAAVFALQAFGIRGKNDLANELTLFIKTELVMSTIVFPLKYTTHELRPDGSNYYSFPSGHTAQAFAAATFLHKEYGDRSIWYSIGGYTTASAVGALRILNNKHWLPDVLTGAGIGILSANLVYLASANHSNATRKKKTHTVILPTYEKGPGLYLCLRFL